MASEREQAVEAAAKAIYDYQAERVDSEIREMASIAIDAAEPHLRDEFVREVAEAFKSASAPDRDYTEWALDVLRERFGEAPATREERD